MAGIDITIDTSVLDEALNVLGPVRAGRALARAVNKTARPTVRRFVLKTLSTQTGLSQKTFNQNVRVIPVALGKLAQVTSGKTGAVGRGISVVARVVSKGKDISVSRFKPKQNKVGVTFKPGRNINRGLIPHAFITTLPNGRQQVMIRSNSAKDVRVFLAQKRFRRHRVRPRPQNDLPIAKVTVPGVSTVMLDAAIQKSVKEKGEITLRKRIPEEINFELLKSLGRIKPKPRKRRINT